MIKSKVTAEQVLEKLDRVILYLTEERLVATGQDRWDACHDGILLLKGIRLAMVGKGRTREK